MTEIEPFYRIHDLHPTATGYFPSTQVVSVNIVPKFERDFLIRRRNFTKIEFCIFRVVAKLRALPILRWLAN